MQCPGREERPAARTSRPPVAIRDAGRHSAPKLLTRSGAEQDDSPDRRSVLGSLLLADPGERLRRPVRDLEPPARRAAAVDGAPVGPMRLLARGNGHADLRRIPNRDRHRTPAASVRQGRGALPPARSGEDLEVPSTFTEAENDIVRVASANSTLRRLRALFDPRQRNHGPATVKLQDSLTDRAGLLRDPGPPRYAAAASGGGAQPSPGKPEPAESLPAGRLAAGAPGADRSQHLAGELQRRCGRIQAARHARASVHWTNPRCRLRSGWSSPREAAFRCAERPGNSCSAA